MELINRRGFIKTAAGVTGYLTAVGLPLTALAKKKTVKLTILHSNDIHSHIDKYPDNDPRYPGLGGAARKAAAIKKIREKKSSPKKYFSDEKILTFSENRRNFFEHRKFSAKKSGFSSKIEHFDKIFEKILRNFFSKFPNKKPHEYLTSSSPVPHQFRMLG